MKKILLVFAVLIFLNSCAKTEILNINIATLNLYKYKQQFNKKWFCYYSINVHAFSYYKSFRFHQPTVNSEVNNIMQPFFVYSPDSSMLVDIVSGSFIFYENTDTISCKQMSMQSYAFVVDNKLSRDSFRVNDIDFGIKNVFFEEVYWYNDFLIILLGHKKGQPIFAKVNLRANLCSVYILNKKNENLFYIKDVFLKDVDFVELI